MAFLRAALDDPELEPGWECGRCDRCGGVDLPAAPDPEAVTAARADMDRPGVDLVARRQWPSGMDRLGIDLSGRIPPGEQAATGRAVARLDGLGWSAPLRELFDARTPDGETPVALRKAAARVLDEWRVAGTDGAPAGTGTAGAGADGSGTDGADGGPADAEVPVLRDVVAGVVWIRSSTRPRLVQHLAEGLARYLGRPVVGTIGPVAGQEAPGRHDVNSATRLAGVARRLQLELSDGARAGLPGRAVLLVDDSTDSGWTLTVASRLLRQAGASAVHPFVLAQR